MRAKNGKKERQNPLTPDRAGVNATGVCGTRIFPEARSMAHPPDFHKNWDVYKMAAKIRELS